MQFNSIGDLSQNLLLRQHNVRARENISQLTVELASGETADISSHLDGNYVEIGAVERDLVRLQGLDTVLFHAATVTSVAQATLESFRFSSLDLANELGLAEQVTSSSGLSALTEQAELVFSAMVGSLNQSAAGQSLFAGSAIDQKAIADAETILGALRLEVAGETTPEGFRDAILNWFNDPAGFAEVGYLGDDGEAPRFNLRNGDHVSHGIRADDQAFRDVLGHIAVSVLAAEGSESFGPEGQSQLMVESSVALLGKQDQLLEMQARLGSIEEAIFANQAQNSNERASLELTYNSLISVDQFDTATRLEEARLQLEHLYTLTVRLSRLSLTEYL